MSRRVELEDKHAELELQTFNLSPERWGKLYRDTTLAGATGKQPGDQGNAFGEGEREIPVTDINDINEWYEGMSKTRGITGEQADRFDDPAMKFLGVATGEGRRV